MSSGCRPALFITQTIISHEKILIEAFFTFGTNMILEVCLSCLEPGSLSVTLKESGQASIKVTTQSVWRCWGITLGLSAVSFIKGSLKRTNGGEEKWFPLRLVQRKWKNRISASPPNLIGITGNVLSGQAAAKGSRSVTVHNLIYSGSCIILYISLPHCLRDGGGSAYTSRHIVRHGGGG